MIGIYIFFREDSQDDQELELTVVIPVYNEGDNIIERIVGQQIAKTLEAMKAKEWS